MKPKRFSIFANKKPSTVGKKIEAEWRSSLLSCLVDMYSHPDMIELHFPPHGKQQRLQNTKRIRSYFTKSLRAF